MSVATTATRTGCEITVTVRIEFEDDTDALDAAAFQQLVQNWEQSIEDLWNGSAGSQSYGCCSVTFNVVTRIGSGTDGFHQVRVVDGPQTSVAGLGPDSETGRWDHQDTGAVVAHETGHLLCLPDEYDYGGPDGSYRNLNPQPAGDPQSIMAQTWGNAVALQEHIDQVMACVDMTCPWYCCLLRFLRRYRLVFLERVVGPLVEQFRLPPGVARLLGERQPHQAPPETDRPAMQDDSIDAILDAIRSGDPDALSAGATELAERGEKNVETLHAALTDDSTLVRWAAAAALGEIRSDDAMAVLRERLEDQDVRVRVVAADSLLKLGETEGVPVLIRALDRDDVMIGHPPELTSEYAAQVLRRMSGEHFGFDASAPTYERERARQRWETWWEHEEQ